MEWMDAAILGLVQGITEFLPVSSTGHLVLFRDWLGVEGTDALAIDAVLHLASTAAVILYFRNDLWELLQVALRKLGRLPVNEKDMILLYALMIATIPAVLLGLLLETIIDNYLRNPLTVAIILFLASVFFMFAEWRYYLRPTQGELTVKKGFLVGLYQAMALMPGMSRSGSTIAGGMLLGLSRYEASRFSFLLAIPITLGVGCKMLLELMQEGATVHWTPIVFSAVITFVTSLFVIHFFLRFIRTYTLWPFVWYGIILAGFVGYVAVFTI